MRDRQGNPDCSTSGLLVASISEGAVAQLGERRPCKAEVAGSNPVSSTNRAARVQRDVSDLPSLRGRRIGGFAPLRDTVPAAH
jgi:hypothetical protein